MLESGALQFEALDCDDLVDMVDLLAIDGVFSHLLLCEYLHFDAVPLHVLLLHEQKLFVLKSRVVFLFRQIL